MEIERKWLVNGWPPGDHPVIREEYMEQGYLSLRPSVRIRRSEEDGKGEGRKLTIKTGGGLARHEVEMSISKEDFDELAVMIGLPLIGKKRRTYLLPDGCKLEVNHVEEGRPEEFWYAEIEYPSVEEALAWDADSVCLGSYLENEATYDLSQTMSAFWSRTRLGAGKGNN